MKFTKTRYRNVHLTEWLVYVILWGLILVSPILSEFNSASNYNLDFSWFNVIRAWENIFPFFILFLLHRIPLKFFLLRRKIGPYIVSVIVMLCLFFSVSYFGVQHRRMPEPEIPKAYRRPPGPPMFGPERGPEPFGFPRELSMELLIAVLLIGFDLGIVLLFNYQREQERERQIEAQQTRYELNHLKAQINPHFLMNMLNNIHGMVELNPQKAQEMIMELSKMMRHVLYEGSKSYTTLQNEKEFISNYVELMRQRYPTGKIKIDLNLPQEDLSDICIPSLLFTNIIENAFKHGISYRRPSFVEITLFVSGEHVVLECSNSMHPRDKSATEGGLGLSNLKQRLQLLYGDKYEYIVENDGSIYHVKLSIPYEHEDHTLPRN